MVSAANAEGFPERPINLIALFNAGGRYPMAQRGEACLALGWATVASVIGGLISAVVLILLGMTCARVCLQPAPVTIAPLIWVKSTRRL